METVTERGTDFRSLLEALVVDNKDLSHLESLLRQFNLFEAIGATRQELRHSDFLRFLLDPKENHGLSDDFVKTLFKKALLGTTSQGFGAIDIDVADLSDAEVERERSQIDLLIHSERNRLVLAIENKVDSLEHDDQLKKYDQVVDREFPDHRKALIFLTPDGDPPSSQRWLAMSYRTLMDAVQSVLASHRRTLAPAVVTTLEHYVDLIGRHIVSDSKVAKLCRQIYRKHKDALDLIYEHRPDLQLDVKSVLEAEVSKHTAYKLDHCTKSAVRFLPISWDSDSRATAGEGWTPTGRLLLFELANSPDNVRLKLIIGPARNSNTAAGEFRNAVFACSQNHRPDFPGASGPLYPRWTTIMSKELVRKKDYTEDPAGVPSKAAEALRHAFEQEIPRIIDHLREVISDRTARRD